MSPNNKSENAVKDSYLVAQCSKVLTCRCAEDIIQCVPKPFASSNSTIRLIIQGTL